MKAVATLVVVAEETDRSNQQKQCLDEKNDPSTFAVFSFPVNNTDLYIRIIESLFHSRNFKDTQSDIFNSKS